MYPTKLLLCAYEMTHVLTPDFIELNETELEQLSEELSLYNNHIKNILNGTAPNHCYSSLKDKEKFFMTTIRGRSKIDGIPDSYRYIDRGFSECRENEPLLLHIPIHDAYHRVL